jgi:hypothetical protein
MRVEVEGRSGTKAELGSVATWILEASSGAHIDHLAPQLEAPDIGWDRWCGCGSSSILRPKQWLNACKTQSAKDLGACRRIEISSDL